MTAERISSEYRQRARARSAAVISSLMLVASCGQNGQPIIEHDQPATLLDKSKDSHYVSGTGYDHWETDYEFVLKQCEREAGEAVDEDGCITLLVNVSGQTYKKFDEGDVITFENDMHGTSVY